MKSLSLLFLTHLVSLGVWISTLPTAHAYATYSRLGYMSCTACHFDPNGGGLLTPYGLGVQDAMSAFPRNINPEEQRFYQGTEIRAIELGQSGGSIPGSNPFLMQADYLGTAFITKNVHFDAEIGPNLQQGSGPFITEPSGWNGVVLRRGIFTADLNSGDTIQAGRDEPVAGLNIDDHTSFLRIYNRRGIYDYPTQLRYVYQGDKLQFLPYLDFPSGEEAQANQEYGGGMRGEYLLGTTNSIGWEGLYGNTATISRVSGGSFFRLSHDHWNGFIGEYVFTHFDEHGSGAAFNQQTLYLKPYIAIPEWIETGFVYEFLAVSPPFYENAFQYGPEVNIRLDRYTSLLGGGREQGISGQTDWSWYGQLFFHVEI